VRIPLYRVGRGERVLSELLSSFDPGGHQASVLEWQFLLASLWEAGAMLNIARRSMNVLPPSRNIRTSSMDEEQRTPGFGSPADSLATGKLLILFSDVFTRIP